MGEEMWPVKGHVETEVDFYLIVRLAAGAEGYCNISSVEGRAQKLVRNPVEEKEGGPECTAEVKGSAEQMSRFPVTIYACSSGGKRKCRHRLLSTRASLQEGMSKVHTIVSAEKHSRITHESKHSQSGDRTGPLLLRSTISRTLSVGDTFRQSELIEVEMLLLVKDRREGRHLKVMEEEKPGKQVTQYSIRCVDSACDHFVSFDASLTEATIWNCSTIREHTCLATPRAISTHLNLCLDYYPPLELSSAPLSQTSWRRRRSTAPSANIEYLDYLKMEQEIQRQPEPDQHNSPNVATAPEVTDSERNCTSISPSSTAFDKSIAFPTSVPTSNLFLPRCTQYPPSSSTFHEISASTSFAPFSTPSSSSTPPSPVAIETEVSPNDSEDTMGMSPSLKRQVRECSESMDGGREGGPGESPFESPVDESDRVRVRPAKKAKTTPSVPQSTNPTPMNVQASMVKAARTHAEFIKMLDSALDALPRPSNDTTASTRSATSSSQDSAPASPTLPSSSRQSSASSSRDSLTPEVEVLSKSSQVATPSTRSNPFPPSSSSSLASTPIIATHQSSNAEASLTRRFAPYNAIDRLKSAARSVRSASTPPDARAFNQLAYNVSPIPPFRLPQGLNARIVEEEQSGDSRARSQALEESLPGEAAPATKLKRGWRSFIVAVVRLAADHLAADGQ